MPKRTRAVKAKNIRGLGPGKAGSGKRLIHQAGGGKGAVRAWRSLSQTTRKKVKAGAAAHKGSYDILGTIRNLRKG